MRTNVAPIVPTMRYWNAASRARLRRPIATSAYEDSDVISRKTKALNASPVAAMPSSPVRFRQRQA